MFFITLTKSSQVPNHHATSMPTSYQHVQKSPYNHIIVSSYLLMLNHNISTWWTILASLPCFSWRWACADSQATYSWQVVSFTLKIKVAIAGLGYMDVWNPYYGYMNWIWHCHVCYLILIECISKKVELVGEVWKQENINVAHSKLENFFWSRIYKYWAIMDTFGHLLVVRTIWELFGVQ